MVYSSEKQGRDPSAQGRSWASGLWGGGDMRASEAGFQLTRGKKLSLMFWERSHLKQKEPWLTRASTCSGRGAQTFPF